jgi:hypothetical protein
MKRAALATGLMALCTTGGCSMFNYDADNSPPPQVMKQPTTVPSNEVRNESTVGGTLREVFIDFPTRIYEYATGKTPTNEAKQMEDAKTADARRVGINSLVDRSFGRQAPYTTRYAQIGQFDADPMVRATALRALNRARDGEATGLFITSLADTSTMVRLEAAKALGNVPNENAADPLLKVFNNPDESIDVRIAAADALRHYRRLDVARALVGVLEARDFSLSWQARQSLRAMTGRDARYDQSAWLQMLSDKQSPLG